MDLLTRFSNKVSKDESTECHEWQSTLSHRGYGKFWFDNRQAPAHRVSYLLYVGDIPEGAWVLHKCDNRKCVNPAHLYLGDAVQNAKDRSDRARWTHEKLSTEDVESIRTQYAAGGITQQELAAKFKCAQTQISKIVRKVQRTIK